MFLILRNYIRKISKNIKYVNNMQEVCGILACDVVRSDRNLLEILREMLPTTSGARQYVFSHENSVLFFRLVYEVSPQDNNLCVLNSN